MSQYARKTDKGHAEIRDRLRELGYEVFDVHCLPGRLDLDVLSKSGLVIPMEIKTPGEKLTDKEEKYLEKWPGVVVYNLQQAIDIMREVDQWRIEKL